MPREIPRNYVGAGFTLNSTERGKGFFISLEPPTQFCNSVRKWLSQYS